ncbi:hypothetical protein WICPIJ_009221 [Wickerhamomyces pijperi]|uniref:Uncharacterized protein n=1 Tax=Wickerhamomyces pijperi TaxID=599730 RepID=A0A9P8TEJ5_WICPI|nr:hypothetical protein WICPIJ_009221 [Wickerhamomyces pijperi]
MASTKAPIAIPIIWTSTFSLPPISLSKEFVSFENLLMILPIGVVSKNHIGACNNLDIAIKLSILDA